MLFTSIAILYNWLTMEILVKENKEGFDCWVEKA